jgi:hypothetical protein
LHIFAQAGPVRHWSRRQAPEFAPQEQHQEGAPPSRYWQKDKNLRAAHKDSQARGLCPVDMPQRAGLSAEMHPAIDDNQLARDHIAAFDKEQGGIGDIFRLANRLERDAVFELLLEQIIFLFPITL